ncbi:MAG: AI-2E family transporter, partial [Candidatus Woesearchaeota archaeon]|nr:AI-2E family transporter [Candidatus Woesearchaeota archaeon]
RVKFRGLAALITTIIALLLITTPLAFVLNTATAEAHFFYMNIKQRLAIDSLINVDCPSESTSFFCNIVNRINDLSGQDDIQSKIKEMLSNAITWLAKATSEFVLTLPHIILNFVITLFTLFYLFLDGKTIADRLYRALPFKNQHQKAIRRQLSNVIYATVYGSIIIAVLQGVLAGIGFWVFGIGSPVVWAMVTTVLAFIPFIGAWLVWLPAGVLRLIEGYDIANAHTLWSGILLLVYGLIIISGIDNLLKPKIIGERARVHPILIMIGALGGLLVFGPVGFVVGPVALALAKTLFEIYEQEKGAVTTE